MNRVVEEQLKKVQVAQLPPYDETTMRLIIPKAEGIIKTDLILNKCYLIQLEDYIVNPYDGFTLHDNWNKGIPPKHRFLKVEILQLMGKMIRVNSVGYDFINKCDIPDSWEGWLPRKGIKIIEVL